jgi:hypothetical protein
MGKGKRPNFRIPTPPPGNRHRSIRDYDRRKNREEVDAQLEEALEIQVSGELGQEDPEGNSDG